MDDMTSDSMDGAPGPSHTEGTDAATTSLATDIFDA